MFDCVCGAFYGCDDDEQDRAKYFAGNVTWEAIQRSWNDVECNQVMGSPPTCAGKHTKFITLIDLVLHKLMLLDLIQRNTLFKSVLHK